MLFTVEKQQEKENVNAVSQKASDTKKLGGSKFFLFVKRVFDILASFVLGVFLLLPLLIIAVIIMIDSPGAAIFKQARIGKNGKVFYVYKFRTMKKDAPPEVPTNDFKEWDVYMTRCGRFLRSTSIDELPQLWNIFIGDMSFVGYRPVCLAETDLNGLRKEYGVLSIRPGLTGLAQVSGRDNIDYKTKAKLDLEYVEKQSFKLDLYCLFKTVETVLRREGVK